MCETCKIRWIDAAGTPTDDNSPAIGRVRTKDRWEWHHGRQIHFEQSEWFPICAEHAKRLAKPDMAHWIFEPKVQ
jgi:hypothetical protein